MVPEKRWTGDRLDQLKETFDKKFDRVDEKFEKVDVRFESLIKHFDTRLDHLTWGLVASGVVILGALIGPHAF